MKYELIYSQNKDEFEKLINTFLEFNTFATIDFIQFSESDTMFYMSVFYTEDEDESACTEADYEKWLNINVKPAYESGKWNANGDSYQNVYFGSFGTFYRYHNPRMFKYDFEKWLVRQ